MAYGVNAPFGFVPYSHLLGHGLPIQRRPYNLSTTVDGLTTFANSLFTGDPVFWNNLAANNGGGTISNLTPAIAALNTNPIGVCDGVEYYDVNHVLQKSPCWIGGTPVYAGTEIKVWVMDDPFIIWNVQYSTIGNVLNDARMLPTYKGQNAKFAIAGGGGNLVPNNPASGNTRTGISAYYIDGSSDGSAATEMCKILDYVNKPENYIYEADGATVRPFLNVQVIFNNHNYKSTGTVAVLPA